MVRTRQTRRCPTGTVPYRIRSGDTLYKLARQFNTTVEAIVSANPGVDPENLRVGRRLCIPRQRTFPPCPGGNYYTIAPGDTMYSIARFFNVSLDDLLEANPGVDPDNLRVGQIICIPLATPPVQCPNGARPYTIKAGDTFYRLARRANIPLDCLIEANPDVNPDALLIGQKICIPSAAWCRERGY